MVPQVPASMDLPKKDAVDHYKKTHTRKITASDTLFTYTMDIFKSLTDSDFAYNNSILDLESQGKQEVHSKVCLFVCLFV